MLFLVVPSTKVKYIKQKYHSTLCGELKTRPNSERSIFKIHYLIVSLPGHELTSDGAFLLLLKLVIGNKKNLELKPD